MNAVDRTTEALADYSSTIEIHKGLRRRMGTQCPPQYASVLALALTKRGVIQSAVGNVADAEADFGQALELKGDRLN